MDDTDHDPDPATGDPRPTRRTVLQGLAAVGAGGAAIPLLAACGSGPAAATPKGKTPKPNAGGGSPTGGGGSGGGGGAGGGKALMAEAGVPVGGGVIDMRAQVVVTQPTKGDFQAFSAVCTHQGCLVATVQGGTINCLCHGSQFSVKDGSVVRGPAIARLPKKKISVKGGEISLA